MICKKCGENLPDNARECFTCGAKVRREAPVVKEEVVAPEPAAPKPPRPSGEVLKEVFSSASYLILCILLTLRVAAVVSVNISMPLFQEFAESTNAESIIDSVISISVQLLLIVPVWIIYFRTKAMKDPVGTDFTKMFRVMHIYTVIGLVAAIIDAVASFVAMAALSLFSFSSVIAEIVSLVLTMLPNYAAYQLTGSLVNSCEKGRMVLEGVAILRVYAIIESVIFIVCVVLSVLVAIIVTPLFFILVVFFLCYALIGLRSHNFLYLLQDKSKY